MTKTDELRILDATIATLTPASYLGPWLASIRGELERDITSDLNPTPDLPGQAIARAQQIVAEARAHAVARLAEADRTIAQRHAAARDNESAMRQRLASALAQALRTIT